ncbi:hypothetical protein [Pedobacter frigidisoli]|nr:hypothetical protein [Pedobacter frigidisoli]
MKLVVWLGLANPKNLLGRIGVERRWSGEALLDGIISGEEIKA